MLSKGTWNGDNVAIPTGGHTDPISNVGAKLLWKYAQKKEKKKHTSDTMNKMNPAFKPETT
uniref:Cytochrome c oxidase subunit III n=1 Tax=Homoiodoris japonica TaxID=1663358 RepID=A0A1R7SVB1_9GAST|nr:cytochrome c oxidase subunit III [Homoiodoris japonica]AKK32252.1 cytochrome c oxidase subunit III [Homoiodoris japonica]